MKKFLSAALLLVLGVPAAPAQDVFDNPDNHPYLGVRLGLDLTCPGDVAAGKYKIDLYNVGAGFNVGAVYNIPVVKNLYFEPGLSLYYSTMGLDIDATDDNGYPADLSASVRRFGFRMPFRFGYRFDFPGASVHAFTGPELEVGLVGRVHTSLNGVSESENLYSDSIFRRTNLGWQFGAGVSFARHWQAEISGTVGMLDLYSGPSSFHQGNVAFTLGYNF